MSGHFSISLVNKNNPDYNGLNNNLKEQSVDRVRGVFVNKNLQVLA